MTSNSMLSPYEPLTAASSVPGVCTWTSPPTCLAVPVSTLQWNVHGQHEYQLHLKVNGVNGLNKLVTSDVYTHYSGAPAAGIVIELALGDAHVDNVSVLHAFGVFWDVLSGSVLA